MQATFEEIKAKVIELAKDGKISCAAAQGVGKALGVEYIVIGRAAQEAGIKISDCQLGCFGGRKDK